MLNHRSIRKYKEKAIPKDVMDKLLIAATRASNTGSMQVYSIIVSQEKELREKLSPLHFNQPMVKQAPAHITFCADINRFHKWCKQRGAEPGYDNLLWFLSAFTDASLASQNFSLAAEENGLGICYLGTCLYNAQEMIDVLDLPYGVFPVASLVVGYPDETPELSPRLPNEAVVHYEKYSDFSFDKIKDLYKETEESEQTKELLRVNEKENLAKVFTENRYRKSDAEMFSKKLLETLEKQGFF